MNGKRQTIWLVSMLSLMVVLSAYYLFTEDSGASTPKETAGTIQVDSVKEANNDPLAVVGDKGIVVNEVVTEGQAAVDNTTAESGSNTALTDEGQTSSGMESNAGNTEADTASTDTSTGSDAKTPASADPAKETAATDSGAKDTETKTGEAQDTAAKDDAGKDTASKDTAGKDTAAATTEQSPAKDDEAILDEVASQSVSASSLFTNYLYEREQKNLKDHNDLLASINDMNKTPADNAVAQEQLRHLEEKESKITGIEEQLQQKYGEAIVKEEAGDSYKIVVLSDKLDVKQAVGIVDLVMKELSVSQDKVSVQYVSEQ
ncbi:SpoIIIAH-like family protein [Paenibacillus albidus]|uniref:SpoIIIAH-like family protein n=1 Tax=Paenibacillus albidus TaxID=2041023 RepID=UPI001BE92BE8|nr:SpoIIIAH-like family protein [Paenibacillus albidus]MBT2290677.1 SpoIIIAH-like family protein [Paenibacillus albidus]